MTALAAVFLAQAAPVSAAPEPKFDRPQWSQGRGGPERGDADRGGPERRARDQGGQDRGGQDRGRGEWRGRGVSEAPAVRPAPTPPQARERRGDPRLRGDSMGRPGPWVQPGQPRRAEPGQTRSGRDEHRRDWDGRRDGDRREWSGERDRRDWDRRDRDGRDWDRRDWDRRDGGRRDWDRRDGRRDYGRWERGRYPSTYFSSQRYRHSWRPPVGYYAHAWGYGDRLPRGWYGSGWWLTEPWAFGLPFPPPGYEWVRIGDDALLVDQFTGQIVQVVRDVFW